MFEKLPDELKQDALFYLWRYEQRKGYAKPTKMPCCLDGQRASSTDRALFCSFKGQSFLKTTNFSKTVDLETSLMLITIQLVVAKYITNNHSGIVIHN